MKSILEEAVDDVTALKKAAEENAKNLLVEAMSPKIRDFIQANLGQDGVDIASALDEEGQNDLDQEPGSENADDAFEDEGSDETIDDEDEDLPCDDEDIEDEDEDEFDTDVDVDTNEGEEMGEAKKKKDKDEDEDEDKDDTVEMTAEDLKRAFAEVLQSGLSEDKGSKGKAKLAEPQDPNDGEFGLVHKVPGEVQWADGHKVIKKAKHAKMITKEAHQKAVHKLVSQNAQLAETVKYLKKNLNEMNIFNAKLLYTTKLLQNNLSTKQKLNVVESIDRAKTKSEVELLYKTLSESFKIAGVMSESKNKGQRASRVAKPSSTLNEGKTQESSQANRWAQLAGLVS